MVIMWFIEFINTTAGSMIIGALIATGASFLTTKQSNRYTKKRDLFFALKTMHEAILVLQEEISTRLKVAPVFDYYRDATEGHSVLGEHLLTVDVKARMPQHYFRQSFCNTFKR